MLKSISELDGLFLSFMPSSGNIGDMRENRLKRMEMLLERIGSPEKSYKTIHLAGSKGKGTTATLLAVAMNTSFKTGLYRSPHVYDLRERFTLAGTFFSDEEYLRTADELMEKIQDLDFSPTTFELYTAYAYLLFKNAGCEYAVIETGLGGRLDATNTIESIMEILLPIEMEHVEILGDTIEKISVEKSKIIKKNSIVIVSDVRPEAYDVFFKETERTGSSFYSFKDDIKDFEHSEEKEYSISRFRIGDDDFSLHTKLRSREIGKNFVITTLALKKLGLLCEKALQAMEDVTIEGRFEQRCEEGKKIVLDVAHTKDSMQNLINTFTSLYERKDTVVLYAAISGKDYRAMLSLLLSSFNRIVITKAGNFKKSDPDALYEEAMRMKRRDQEVYLIHDEKEAFIFSKHLADIILITGSFYLVGEFGEDDA